MSCAELILITTATTRVTGWEPRNCRRSQERQRTRWRDEIRTFAGAGWSTLTPDSGPGGEMRLQHLPGEGWSMLTADRGPGGEIRLEHLPGQEGVHQHQTAGHVER